MDPVFDQAQGNKPESNNLTPNSGQNDLTPNSNQQVQTEQPPAPNQGELINAQLNPQRTISDINAEITATSAERMKYSTNQGEYWTLGDKLTRLQGEYNDAKHQEQQVRINALYNQSGLDAALAEYSSHPNFDQISANVRTQFSTPKGMEVLGQLTPEGLKSTVGTLFKTAAYDFLPNQGSSTPPANVQNYGGASQPGEITPENVLANMSADQREAFNHFRIPVNEQTAPNIAKVLKHSNERAFVLPLKGLRPKGSLNLDFTKEF